MLNPRLERLGSYAFARLAALLGPEAPPEGVEPIDVAIGEPKHPVPGLVAETLAANAHLWNRYPSATGTADFRAAAGAWLARRYALPPGLLDPDRDLLPVAGTKEALFLLGQLLVPETKAGGRPAVLLPNPFYNVYLGSAVMNGAEPVFLTADAASGFLPDLDSLDPATLDRTALVYLTSPANPQGAAASLPYLRRLLGLARAHDFVLVADECYAELYDDAPPPGALEAAAATGALDNLLVLHSLSKRSNAAGLRSGFVAGDRRLIAAFTALRNFAAPVQPLPVLAAAAALWRDEDHVVANRALYRVKFDDAADLLDGRFAFFRPDGGFFLWLEAGDGEATARRLWREAGLRVLPGGYLARPTADGRDPGAAYVRVALVHDRATTRSALERLAALPDRPNARAA